MSEWQTDAKERPTYRYTPLWESIRANGDRHAARGRYYSMVGRHDYACGSYAKAARNYEKAFLLRNFMRSPTGERP